MVQLEGNSWFVAADVCRALDLSLVSGATTHLRKLQADEVQQVPPNLIRGKGMSQASIISESGMYKLVNRSDKERAKKFQHWITAEVLPSIRKNGGYIKDQEKVVTGEMSMQELALAVTSSGHRKLSPMSIEKGKDQGRLVVNCRSVVRTQGTCK